MWTFTGRCHPVVSYSYAIDGGTLLDPNNGVSHHNIANLQRHGIRFQWGHHGFHVRETWWGSYYNSSSMLFYLWKLWMQHKPKYHFLESLWRVAMNSLAGSLANHLYKSCVDFVQSVRVSLKLYAIRLLDGSVSLWGNVPFLGWRRKTQNRTSMNIVSNNILIHYTYDTIWLLIHTCL